MSWSIALEEGGLALLRLTLDLRAGGRVLTRSGSTRTLSTWCGWAPAVEAALVDHVDGSQAAQSAEKYADGFPQGYRIGAGPEEAAIDIPRNDPPRGCRG